MGMSYKPRGILAQASRLRNQIKIAFERLTDPTPIFLVSQSDKGYLGQVGADPNGHSHIGAALAGKPEWTHYDGTGTGGTDTYDIRPDIKGEIWEIDAIGVKHAGVAARDFKLHWRTSDNAAYSFPAVPDEALTAKAQNVYHSLFPVTYSEGSTFEILASANTPKLDYDHYLTITIGTLITEGYDVDIRYRVIQEAQDREV
jgi:hypothetical protein